MITGLEATVHEVMREAVLAYSRVCQTAVWSHFTTVKQLFGVDLDHRDITLQCTTQTHSLFSFVN